MITLRILSQSEKPILEVLTSKRELAQLKIHQAIKQALLEKNIKLNMIIQVQKLKMEQLTKAEM